MFFFWRRKQGANSGADEWQCDALSGTMGTVDSWRLRKGWLGDMGENVMGGQQMVFFLLFFFVNGISWGLKGFHEDSSGISWDAMMGFEDWLMSE